MTIEQFLSFLNQHNIAIIEGLVVVIILLSLFVAYSGFFSKKDAGHSDHGHGEGLNTAELEKTLQKILDNQKSDANHHAVIAPEPHEDAPPPSAAVSALAAEGARESAAEITQLRTNLGDREKRIETLQAQLTEAMQKSTASAAAAPASGAEIGMSTKERDDFAAKVRDLEARLAEYEIISEDIADLSRYKDENDKLKAEIETLKSSAPAAAPAPQAPPAAPAAPAAPPQAAAAPQPPPAEAVAAAPADDGANLIDDELMKEFAAAVEGQKSTIEKVSEKAGTGEAKKPEEGDQLMNEFENFVKKS